MPPHFAPFMNLVSSVDLISIIIVGSLHLHGTCWMSNNGCGQLNCLADQCNHKLLRNIWSVQIPTTGKQAEGRSLCSCWYKGGGLLAGCMQAEGRSCSAPDCAQDRMACSGLVELLQEYPQQLELHDATCITTIDWSSAAGM